MSHLSPRGSTPFVSSESIHQHPSTLPTSPSSESFSLVYKIIASQSTLFCLINSRSGFLQGIIWFNSWFFTFVHVCSLKYTCVCTLHLYVFINYWTFTCNTPTYVQVSQLYLRLHKIQLHDHTNMKMKSISNINMSASQIHVRYRVYGTLALVFLSK